MDNQAWAQASPSYSTAELFRTYYSFPPYYDYDEYSSLLCFTLLEGKDRVWFEEANEYTVALTLIFLRDTDVKVFCQDERLLWFYPASDRLTIGGKMPEKDEPGLLRVIATYFSSMFNKNYDTVDSVTCFHHVMLQQWIAKGKHKSARYVELNLPRDEGIGSILGTYTDLVNFVKRAGQQILARPGTSRYVQGQMDTTLDYGWLQVTVRPGTSRYSDKLLEKYFNVKMTPMDAFPDKVITIAQERYSVKDFEVAQTISELETMRRSPEEYELYVEDTTVNYFYGIYLVSRCYTFIHSNNCCGAQLVKSFGEGIIKRTYCIAEELMKEHK